MKILSSFPELNNFRLDSRKYLKNEKGLRVIKQCPHNFPLHWHNFFELEIVLQGHAVQLLNGKEYKISRGCAYILSPTDYHKVTISSDKLLLWNVMFDESMLSFKNLYELTSSKYSIPFFIDEKELQQIDSLLSLLKKELDYNGESCYKELFQSLLCLILRTSKQDKNSFTESYTEIQRAIIYLETHFRESPTLQEVALYIGFHPAYFSKLFKKVTGNTFVDTLNQLRINYAKNLLKQGLPVTDVCFACGFNSLSNFQHTFKKLTSKSPSEFKKQ